MGVRGLTTYIATNAERFLRPFELHDCSLVIDGDNLCIQLFVRSEEQVGAFGGNYDHYFRAVVAFFELLAKCNVQPYVLLDGGYERNKLKTVCSRMLGRIQIVKYVKAVSNRTIIPLLIREVFVDALRAMRVPFMRCLFEADNEIAILARKLNCPVLSYDSDFYIHNVKYIPYVTITHKIYRRVVESEQKYTIELVDRKNKGRDRVLAKQGDGDIQPDQIQEAFCYLDCSLYTIEQLIGSEDSLNPEMLPLFATLLGNDYIERRVLSRFYSTMKVGKVSRKVAPQQRRIVAILKWLRHHSVQSATKTILNQVQDKRRDALMRQLRGAMYGYNCEECTSYEYFGFQDEAEAEGNADNFLEHFEDDSSEAIVEQELVDEEKTLETDSVSEEIPDEEDDPESASDETEYAESEKEEEQDCELSCFTWEPWLVDIYQAGLTPRFVVDLYHSSQYINYPQVENIAKPDSNEICYNILRYIFALLKSSNRGHNFRYLTRCQNVAHYRWVKFQEVQLPEFISFHPNKEKNMPLLKVAFDELANCEDVFLKLHELPINQRLYFLCIIYWAFKSDSVSCIHVHALILCLIQLQYVDKHLTNKSRDQKVFQTNLKTYLDTQKKSFAKSSTPDLRQNEDETTTQIIKRLSTAVKKPEATLSYEILLPHFSIPERNYRRHAEFDREVAHTFAELQAVMLNVFTLNALLRHPFEPLRVHEFYNGLFIHNLYQSLKTRSDPMEYIRRTIFRYSSTLSALHLVFYEFVIGLVPRLKNSHHTISVKSKPKKKSKNSKRMSSNRKRQDVELNKDEVDADSDSDEFSDVNNMFHQLMISGQ
ncbi:protein asteroid isoform X2 [Wyeomyia smithii]|uniref:protein asteroid isoform X2 n=1 Tax=Wyeomyia smithii TaxID=174621 RepID=UPI002467AD2C|nr:protein asteroid isoform X2 [Wyeomyia smithii]